MVTLGIGLPALVANHIPEGKIVFFHSENGIISLSATPEPERADSDVVNASKKHATFIPGAAIVYHAGSFSLIRSGRLYFILGGLQVAPNGDIANWKVLGQKGGGGVGVR